MSAVLRNIRAFRPMGAQDLAAVMAVEQDIYPFPWTLGNFRDSLNAGYSCWICESGNDLIGYAVMMLAAGEAHILNLGIARAWQRQGMGRKFMEHLLEVGRGYHAETMFLEVRPTNIAARRLYDSIGFNEIAVRRNYYPAHNGREDALLMGLNL